MLKASTSLIAEGGGMRGAYTSGVLEVFLDHGITFPYAIGVSAGSNTLCSYLSEQKLRNKRIYTHWITDKRFIGFKNLLTEGAYFGMDFIFNELPMALDPFDFERFKQTNTQFKVGVTNCLTGKCEYFEPTKEDTLEDSDRILKASSSLPFISKVVDIHGIPYLDGGLTDPIPIKKAIQDGYKRHVIILTRNADYRKKYSKTSHHLAKHHLKDYPLLIEALEVRYQKYNQTLDFISQLEKAHQAFVLRPTQPLEVDRFEKDSAKLTKLYEQGYAQALSCLPELVHFISH